jgi:Flp pilus assembly protein TadG
MILRTFIRSESGVAATEMALITPLLVILLFGGSEAGHFVWTQHKLTEAVRDGARYASRLNVYQVCDGATELPATTEKARVVLLTRTGQLANANVRPVVPGWTAGQVTVEVTCQAFVGTGIYTELGTDGPGPVVTVAATNVTYPSLFNALGRITRGVSLNARSSAAVIGI